MMKPMTPQSTSDLTRKLTNARPYVFAGFIALLVLFGGVGVWAATTKIAGAVLGPGTVVVASNVKKIQHPTGGVVGEIDVKNGDHVKAGDLLVRLDETLTRANLGLVTAQINELLGRKARLSAERDDAATVTFPSAFNANTPALAQIMSGEQKLFEQRISTRKRQDAQLAERINGLKEEIAGLAAQAVAKTTEIDLIAKELSSLTDLEVKKLVPTSKMMSLRREGARLDGEKSQLSAAIGQSKQRIAEIEVQRLGLDSEAKSDVMKDLRETEGKLAELDERRVAAEDQLQRVEIRSPVNGIVHQMSVATLGGVINPGDTLMLIVPEGDELLVEAKIAPQDIDLARSSHDATIRLTAFDQRTTPVIEGKILNIAADLTREERTGLQYYIARIEIPDSELSRVGHLKLFPGMPAEVQITTGYRTAWSYLMKPIEDQFAKAFKER